MIVTVVVSFPCCTYHMSCVHWYFLSVGIFTSIKNWLSLIVGCCGDRAAMTRSLHVGMCWLGIEPKHDWIFLMAGQTTNRNKS